MPTATAANTQMVNDICLIFEVPSPPRAKHTNAAITKGPVALSPLPKINNPIAESAKIAEQASKNLYTFSMIIVFLSPTSKRPSVPVSYHSSIPPLYLCFYNN